MGQKHDGIVLTTLSVMMAIIWLLLGTKDCAQMFIPWDMLQKILCRMKPKKKRCLSLKGSGPIMKYVLSIFVRS